MKIGFIGLGHMGQPMATNLLADHELVVFDKQEQACEQLAKQGAQVASHAGKVAKDADVVFTMLQSHDQVAMCCLGEQGIFATIQSQQTLFIDCSTIDITASRQLHQQAASRNIAMLDAPVSGGVAAAKAKTLTFMVGGKLMDFQRAEKLLLQLGKAAIHAGEAGNGTAAKICNNMILGISMIAVSEGFNLAEKLGLPAKTLFDICSQASAQCWSLTSYCPAPGVLPNVPSSNEYQPGFAAKMMLKDLNLSQQAAHNANVPIALGEQAQALYQRYVEQGNADKDFSGIIDMLLGEKTTV